MSQLKVIANDMLPVYENENGDKVINARELHSKLMVSTRFNDWISRHIDNYGFIENEDFYSFLSKTNGRPSEEFLFTLDAGKEIAMVQRNEIGRAMRKYFIEVEKQFMQQKPKSQLEILQASINQLVEQERKMQVLEHKQMLIEKENQVLKTRVDNLDQVNIEGNPRQQFNSMIRLYAHRNGGQYSKAWKDFVQAFNTAFQTNFELKRQNYINKVGKDVSRPQYLDETGQLDDAIRVADKLLNQKKKA
ncbi:antA/AntB antirepressor family protein [Heyndrickxia camelliae]|uniref:AntA/AntB antirepressor domain-containing protein n=1 Tax=Heyndrickxia camelliae TaxID=1707093 RepID=A0A2N3LNG3_9BACI|nr:antA/AntB antirepressor family protein [Heyndrickxia camelliae]PKR86125.1 hypothetical protein CWO92_07060 [Heyndrickxia camelliae]